MRASGYERVASDWYVEPASCVEALLKVERFDGLCWDPACGGGNIPRTLIDNGLEAIGSDIADRGYGAQCDFFTEHTRVANIVSNPPYGVIQTFIDHALTRTTGKVAILARLALLEGQARKAWFEASPLARVWVSSRRLSMPPGGTDVPAKGGAIAYAWFVFEHGHTGPAAVGWVS